VVDEIGHEAGDLKMLMDRVASLRATGNDKSPRVKMMGTTGNVAEALSRGGLRPPLPGAATPGDPAGPGQTPGAAGPAGLWFEGSPKGEAVAPGDSEVVFAGNYQKLGQVLILELAGGYHLALAGLGRINVHIGDLVLAGEPVGTLPEGKVAPLYMELRRNGKVVDLAPYMSADIGKAKRS
jgi:murein hydrolase activator